MSKLNEWLRLGVVYPLAEKIKGTNSIEWYHRIHKMNMWSREEIRVWQEEQLRKVVNQAYYHTIYWRRVFDDRGLKPEDIYNAEDLKKLPILTKNDVRAHYNDMVPDNVALFPHRYERTGGTTGEPMQYLVDENIWGVTSAHKILSWKTTGYMFGDAFMALGSASILTKNPSFVRRVIDLIRNERAYNSMNMDDALCQKYIDILAKQQIHYIYGYASSIYLLAKYVLDHHIDMSHMRGAFTTSENLTEVYRITIEQAFGCRVMDCYGARDAAVSAYEITPGNYYVGYSALLETVDEFEPNKGTLLSTNLLSMAFPMFRYDYGDIAELDNNSEEYNGQVLHQIYGRKSDVLRLDNGHVLTSPGFTVLMPKFDVKAYDIQKISGSEVKMLLQVAEGWNKEQEAVLIKEMQRYVGDGCDFSIEYVDGFQELKNGKRRYFMNDLSASESSKIS